MRTPYDGPAVRREGTVDRSRESAGGASAPARYPSRREFLGLGLGAFVVMSVPWAARRRDPLLRRTIPVMGTVAEVAVSHRDAAHAQRAIDAAFFELREVETVMTRFRRDSDVGRANLGAAAGPVAISAATAAVLARALEWADVSDGAFDPALGRTVALWDVGNRQAPPSPGEYRRFAGQRLHAQVELGRSGGSDIVIFRSPDVALDLGGIAKGYAVDRAVEALRAWGIGSALVNAGGDLYALGRAPDGEPWEIGIRSPDDASALVATIRAEDRGIATSGDYESFFVHRGRRYHHLLDPSTAEPRRVEARTITVAASDCLTADAAATTLFGAEPSLATNVLSGASGARVVHSG